jgi:hypothetical protein
MKTFSLFLVNKYVDKVEKICYNICINKIKEGKQMNTQMQMVEVKLLGTDNSWLFADVQAAKEFVLEDAQKYHYGLFRYYEIDGTHYYDCGRNTFTTTVKLLSF